MPENKQELLVDEIVRSIIRLKAELDPTLQRPPKVSKLSALCRERTSPPP
jgi:hypothetical protein